MTRRAARMAQSGTESATAHTTPWAGRSASGARRRAHAELAPPTAEVVAGGAGNRRGVMRSPSGGLHGPIRDAPAAVHPRPHRGDARRPFGVVSYREGTRRRTQYPQHENWSWFCDDVRL